MPLYNKEQLLKACIDYLFDLDRRILRCLELQKKIHCTLVSTPNASEDLWKKAKAADKTIVDLKENRKYLQNILFQTTGAFVVPIWYE